MAVTDAGSAEVRADAHARGRRRRVLWSVLGAALVVGTAVGAWYVLPVRSVQVRGNDFLSDRRVMQLAGVRRDFGWLYYGAWQARALEANPWVRSARITKVFPDTVVIDVVERRPSARLERNGKRVVIDWDGTVLPGAPAVGPVVRGWGPDRSREGVDAARLLARYDVKSVAYSPGGLTVETASGTVWSGSLVSLQKYATGVTMYRAKRINIYPWGVSVQE